MGKETVINRNVANNKGNATVINHNLNSENNNSTVINKKLQNGGNVTSINSNVQASEKITKGTLLCNKYQVIKRLSANTGEADLYVCTFEGMNYVAKVYRSIIIVLWRFYHITDMEVYKEESLNTSNCVRQLFRV